LNDCLGEGDSVDEQQGMELNVVQNEGNTNAWEILLLIEAFFSSETHSCSTQI